MKRATKRDDDYRWSKEHEALFTDPCDPATLDNTACPPEWEHVFKPMWLVCVCGVWVKAWLER
jgi:hypothetical protein